MCDCDVRAYADLCMWAGDVMCVQVCWDSATSPNTLSCPLSCDKHVASGDTSRTTEVKQDQRLGSFSGSLPGHGCVPQLALISGEEEGLANGRREACVPRASDLGMYKRVGQTKTAGRMAR